MYKRFWAAFLAICMMVLIMPSTAFADEEVEGLPSNPWNISAVGDENEVNAYMSFGERTLVISGHGKMQNFNTSSSFCPWYKYSGYISDVQIGNEVKNIGDYAFYECELNKIILPGSIEEINAYAFTGCTVPIIDLTKLSDDKEIVKNVYWNEELKIIYLPSETLSNEIKNTKNSGIAIAITNGGTFSDEVEYTSESLLEPTREGYEFKGWYTDSQCTQKAQFAAGGTYYAKWEKPQAGQPSTGDENKGEQTKPNEGNTGSEDQTDPQQPDDSQSGGQATPPPQQDTSGNNDPTTTPNPDDSTNDDQGTAQNPGNSENPDTPNESKKLDYDLSGIEFKDGTAIYNGKAQSLKITGTLPEGVTVTYSYENDLLPVTPGEYTITAEFTGDTEHYNPIPSKTAKLTIEKAEMQLSFGYNTLKVFPTDKPFTNQLSGAPNDSVVTYTSSNKTVADVDENGEVTIIGEGKTTITAAASETPLYKAGSISYELTVAGKPLEEDDPENETLKTITYPNGAKVIVPKEPGRTMTATVVVPDKLDHAVVTIPMEDVEHGTVALNAANGEVIKLCMPDSEGLTVLLDQSMDLIMFDNSKNFKDVSATHWGKDFINFATAHGLFAGMSETEFVPGIPMTRGMMMTVLASFANVETSGGSIWYERGMNWAKAMGISDGTYPNHDITREQLAVMLYHYVGDPAVSENSSEALAKKFPDGKNVSTYAVTAVNWAVENGVISGMANKKLDPQGKATRAQVATMMKRVCEFIINENI